MRVKLHAPSSGCLSEIQAACVRVKLHAPSSGRLRRASGCLREKQVACVRFKLHAPSSGRLCEVQAACVRFRLCVQIIGGGAAGGWGLRKERGPGGRRLLNGRGIGNRKRRKALGGREALEGAGAAGLQDRRKAGSRMTACPGKSTLACWWAPDRRPCRRSFCTRSPCPQWNGAAPRSPRGSWPPRESPC